MGQLSGKAALVTGATSGIGLATARRMAAEGAHVFITGRSQDGIDQAVATIGDSVTGLRSDITKQDDLNALAAAIKAHGRGLDVVFANAGGGEFARLGEITAEHLADTFNRNVGGTVFTVQTMLPLLNPGASIVCRVRPRPQTVCLRLPPTRHRRRRSALWAAHSPPNSLIATSG
jgi:NAD(P)-dependent dehydrogenase (short-subunit alcohol dehydrogenase family)